MTATVTHADPTLRAIAARALAARASTTGPPVAPIADVDFLLHRLEAAERACMAAEAFREAVLPSVNRLGLMAVAEVHGELLRALERWAEVCAP